MSRIHVVFDYIRLCRCLPFHSPRKCTLLHHQLTFGDFVCFVTVCVWIFVQSSPQCPVDSPHISPVPGSKPVSAFRVEEAEMNPSPTCSVPSTSSSWSNFISEWEQRTAQDNRQGYLSPSTPTTNQHPAASSGSRARRRALCWPRQEEDCCYPRFDLDCSASTVLCESEIWLWVLLPGMCCSVTL